MLATSIEDSELYKSALIVLIIAFKKLISFTQSGNLFVHTVEDIGWEYEGS